MNIGLYDIDSRIPNLALMKLASWHKAQGDTASLYSPLFKDTFDKVYASKVFEFSSSNYLGDEMIQGGTGFSDIKMLPPEVNTSQPDYSLYPDCDYSIGFTSRGCRLKCDFCKVPKREGFIMGISTIPDIGINPKSNRIMLLDNDFFGQPEWELRATEIKGYKVSLTQGINCRSLTVKQATVLATMPLYSNSFKFRNIYTAWDDSNDEDQFLRGYKRLRDAGYKGQVTVYVLIGHNTGLEDWQYRVDKLRKLKASPFSMPMDKKNWMQQKFSRWVNQKVAFKSMTFKEFLVAFHGEKVKPLQNMQQLGDK